MSLPLVDGEPVQEASSGVEVTHAHKGRVGLESNSLVELGGGRQVANV